MAKKEKEASQKQPLKGIGEFEKPLQEFLKWIENQNTGLMGIQSRTIELRSEKDKLEDEVQKMRDTYRAFKIKLGEVNDELAARERKLKELINS